MAETGGPVTQSGIYYQNTIAAWLMARMLDLRALPPGEAVVEIRVEALTHVDDIVVRYGDGHKTYIQAKESLASAGDAWTRLWRAFAAQLRSPAFGTDDRLILMLGMRGALSDNLLAMAERVSSSVDRQEWESRLTKNGKGLLTSIEACLPEHIDAFEIFRCTTVENRTLDDVAEEFKRLDLGSATATPKNLLRTLRDMAGGESRVRGIFRAAPLRRRLGFEFGYDLFEPIEWGLSAYRDAVAKTTNIAIPGLGVSVPVQDLIVWPRARRHEFTPESDFEDELPRWEARISGSAVDLSKFPDSELSRCILVAGPGFGKTMLVAAFADQLLKTPIVPVEISLEAFGKTDQNVVEFLEDKINRAFYVKVGWQRLADQGLCCLLFDGLDEVPSSQRADILKRINQFSGRFPFVPWLLTVRDPAVLGGPLQGDIVELKPFENAEISDLVDKFKPFKPGLNTWAFVNGLVAYPDIARLARIPLFLSIMLASWSPNSPIPSKRSGLIDFYLTKLFKPEKLSSVSPPHLSASDLKRAAQMIAYETLEREQIGLSQLQALNSIDSRWPGTAEKALAQLLACGILRERADGRLQFPYPIVQEYLAATYLVAHKAETLAARVGDVAKRPWAQVLQFALELSPDPSPFLSDMLTVPDDVFSTGLRLVGRCIANGAAVNDSLREKVGTLLAEVWGKTSHTNRERIGRLIVDAYSRPLHPEVRKRLGWHWLLASGVCEIVNTANDAALTAYVLDGLLAGNVSMFMNIRDLKGPFQVIASEVALKVKVRAKEPHTDTETFEGLADILDLIRVSGPGAEHLREIIQDPAMPMSLRFSAQAALPTPPPPSVLAEAKQALASDDWKDQSAAMNVFKRVTDIPQVVLEVLTDSSLTSKAQDYLLEHLDRVATTDASREAVCRTVLAHGGLKPRHSDILKVFLVRAGDRDTFLELIDRFDTAPSEIVTAVLNSLNSFPGREIGARAIACLMRRPLSPTEVPRLISSAIHGLTYIISDGGWNHYAMDEAPPHLSLDLWTPVFDKWLGAKGISKVDRISSLTSLIKLRPEILSELQELVFGIQDPDGAEWDDDDLGHVMRRAMDELRRRQVRIPLDLAERFVLAKRANLIFAGANAIAAEPTQHSLALLKSLYRRVPMEQKSTILDAIESVANQLNIKVMPTELA